MRPFPIFQLRSFLKNIKNSLSKQKIVNNRSIPSMQAVRKITNLSDQHSFTLHPSLSPYGRTELRAEKRIHLLRVGWRNLPRFAWAGGTRKKKFQSSVWRVRDRYYDRKKSSSPLSGRWAIVITTRKKVLVVCLVSAQSLLRPEKKFQSSDWRVRDCYYNRKQKFQLSVWQVRDHYNDRKKQKFQSSVWRVRDHYYDRKKRYSRLSGGCAIIITTGKKSSICLSGGCAIVITTKKKKIQSSVWQVCDHYYDRKKRYSHPEPGQLRLTNISCCSTSNG